MTLDNLLKISKETITKANEQMIEYRKIKKENPKAYELIIGTIKNNLKTRYNIEITKEDIIEANNKFIEKYKDKN